MRSAALQVVTYGHACVGLERGRHRIVVDPGALSEVPSLDGCSGVLVSHGHFDHASRTVLEDAVAAGVPIFGPADLSSMLGSDALATWLTVLHPGERRTIGGFDVQVVGGRHAPVHPERQGPANLGYLIDGRVLITGDQHPSVDASVDVLITPVDAPWLRAVDLIAYVRSVRPGTVVGVHDGLLNETGLAVADAVLESLTREGAGRALRLPPGQYLDVP